MARVSFRLRRVAAVAGESADPVVGSFLRGTEGLQNSLGHSPVDQDAALRSTGIIVVSDTVTDSTFEAVAIGYNSVELTWQLSQPFETISEVSGVEIGAGETGLVEVALVYSKTGYPETVSDGDLLFQAPVFKYNHQTSVTITTDQGPQVIFEPPSGQWAYYTLFGYYNYDGPNGTFFYNKLASLEVLVPKDYRSLDALWARVPLYYRELDAANGSTLYRFLNTFAFDIDRMRTLIDSVMMQYDPAITEANSIAELAYMLGLEITPDDLGISRTRSLLHDIGYLRRRKGTIPATKEYLTAVSGASVDVFTSNTAPYFTFCVHSQRVNLVANPRFVGAANWTVEFETSTGGASVDVSAAEGITLYSGANESKIAIRSTVQVPLAPDIQYYSSAEFSNAYVSNIPGASVQYFETQWHTSASWSAWSTAASVSPITYIDNSDDATRLAFPAETTSASVGYPVLVVSLPPYSHITVNKWMVEPYLYGDFFDGNTVFSGYLYSAYGKDHVWSGGSGFEYASPSVYTANRVKTQNVLTRMMTKILPITLLGGATPKYTMNFDWIPGKKP